jgi:hypothetical protein
MIDYPKLSTPILLGLLAILCLVMSWKQDDWPGWVKTLLALAGIFLLVWALITAVDTIQFKANARLREQRQAMAITERVAVLEKIRQMRPDQINALDKYVSTIEIIAGDAGPIYTVRLPTGPAAPLSFIEELIDRGDADHLGPIRNYSEGSAERDWAERFTGFCVFNGWAAPASGPYAARWIDKAKCLHALGLEEG